MSRELSWPLAINNSGGFVFTENPSAQVKNRLRSALGTSRGERVMNSAYGSTLTTAVFQNLDDETENEIITNIQETAARFVPEVRILDVDVQQNRDMAQIDCLVRYLLNNGEEGSVTTFVPLQNGN